MIINTYCRVCGLDQQEDCWNPPNYSICDCCGAEFGLDDTTHEQVIHYRQLWLEKSAAPKWFSPREKPQNWNLEAQMKNIPNGFL